MADTIIMAIESSCDETAVAIIKNGTEILANVVSKPKGLRDETYFSKLSSFL